MVAGRLDARYPSGMRLEGTEARRILLEVRGAGVVVLVGIGISLAVSWWRSRNEPREDESTRSDGEGDE